MVSGFFTKKIAQVKSVGDILEQRRLSLGIAMERVAKETGVQAHYLEALERGARRHLPADIYIRGFISTYARYLRLDEAAVIEQWERERGIAKHMSVPNPTGVAENNVAGASGLRGVAKPRIEQTFPDRRPLLPRVRVTPVMMRSGLIGLAVIAGALYLWLSVSSLGRPPKLMLEEPTSDRAVTDSSIVVVGETQPEAQLTINGQAVFVDDIGHFRETLSLQAGINQIEIVASNKLGRETKIVRNIQANLSPVAVKDQNDSSRTANSADGDKTDEEMAIAEEGVEVTVKINDEATWIEVTVDGKNVFRGTQLPNSQKSFSGKGSIRLTTGKAQNTGIAFKGKELSSLGEGFIRDLEFTPDLSIEDLTATASRQ